MNFAKREITRRFGIDVQTAERMMQAGMTSPGDLAELSDQELKDVTGLAPGDIRVLRQNLQPQGYELNLQEET